MATAVALALPKPAGWANAAANIANTLPADSFSFPLLGDIHFDRLSHHDMEWLKRDHPNDVRQVENYSRITTEVVPGLLQDIKQLITSATAPIPFIVHVGDFVEGLCGTNALAAKQCEETVAQFKSADFARPFLITKGNHDVTGPGATEAYQNVVLPYFINDPIVSDRSGACFAVQRPGSLFAFFDSYDKKSLAWLQQVLEKRRPDPTEGWLFVVIHQPVVPYTARLWHVYEHSKDESKDRQQLLDLLARHRAIVLNGHLHKYGLLSRKTDAGRFVQLSVSSVISTKDFQPKQILEGLNHYGQDLLDLEPNFSPDTAVQRADYLKRELPQLDHFEHADAPGYAMVHVTPKKVTADLYVGLGKKAWKTVDLSSHLISA